LSPDLISLVVLGVVVLGMLALDLFVFHRKAHEASLREAAAWSSEPPPPSITDRLHEGADR